MDTLKVDIAMESDSLHGQCSIEFEDLPVLEPWFSMATCPIPLSLDLPKCVEVKVWNGNMDESQRIIGKH